MAACGDRAARAAVLESGARRLRAWCRAVDIGSASALERAAGLARGTCRRIWLAETAPGPVTAEAIARVVGRTEADVLGLYAVPERDRSRDEFVRARFGKTYTGWHRITSRGPDGYGCGCGKLWPASAQTCRHPPGDVVSDCADVPAAEAVAWGDLDVRSTASFSRRG